MSVTGFVFKGTAKIGGMTARGALRVASAAGNDVMVGLQEGKQQLDIEYKKTAELYEQLKTERETHAAAMRARRDAARAAAAAPMTPATA